MAEQFFHQWFGYFRLDLHGCSAETALKITAKRIDDCYTYGIPFLEIVHGSDEKAKASHKGSLGAVIQKMRHPNIAKMVPLAGYCRRAIISGSSTAIRLCLRENPKPQERISTTVFSGFSRDYLYFPKNEPSKKSVWAYKSEDIKRSVPVSVSMRTVDDIKPFAPVWVSMMDVIDALVGDDPLQSHNRHQTDSLYWEYLFKKLPLQDVRNAVANVLQFPELAQAEQSAECIDLTPTQFEAVKQRLLGGSILPSQIADYTGCPISFLEWCDGFARGANGCRCVEGLAALIRPLSQMDVEDDYSSLGTHAMHAPESGLRINQLDSDGACIKQPCFSPGAESVVKDIWQQYSGAFRQVKDRYRLKSAAQDTAASHCFGRNCACAQNAPCRQGRSADWVHSAVIRVAGGY